MASSVSKPQPSASASQKVDSSKPTSKFSNYSDAKSLGYSDPDEERRLAELERRKTQGVIGQWEIVAPPPPPIPDSTPEDIQGDSKEGILHDDSSRKREAGGPAEDDDHHRWKVRRKVLTAGLGEIWDPGEIPIIPKSKRTDQDKNAEIEGLRDPEQILDAALQPAHTSVTPNTTNGAEKRQWAPKGWKKATVPENELPEIAIRPEKKESEANVSESSSAVKEEIFDTALNAKAAVDSSSRDAIPDIKREEVKFRNFSLWD